MQDAGPAAGAYQISLLLSLTTSQARRLSWTEAGTVYVVIDGKQVGESDLGFLDLPADQAVRGVLLAYKTLPDPLPTPRDQVLLTVDAANVGALHHIQRRPSGGVWAEIAAILGDSYVDGPLPDGTYDYQAIDENDAAGESDPSPTRTVTISSVPDPPGGLRYAWDAGAKTLTLTWQASPSADVAAYRVREGLEPLDLDGTPVQESAALSYQRVFTDESGTFVWSVRAVDADGNEEQNVTQTLALAFQGGVTGRSAGRASHGRGLPHYRRRNDGRVPLRPALRRPGAAMGRSRRQWCGSRGSHLLGRQHGHGRLRHAGRYAEPGRTSRASTLHVDQRGVDPGCDLSLGCADRDRQRHRNPQHACRGRNSPRLGRGACNSRHRSSSRLGGLALCLTCACTSRLVLPVRFASAIPSCLEPAQVPSFRCAS